MNREAWLEAAKDELEKRYFRKKVNRLPKVAVSVGIPARSGRSIGQCWGPEASKGGVTNIFICPTRDDAIDVVGILLHELCHAVVGTQWGHGPKFGRLARQVGLKGRLTSTTVEKGTDTYKYIKGICDGLGKYPHVAMDKTHGTKRREVVKRIRVFSPVDVDFNVTVSEEMVKKFGMPIDPWGHEMVRNGTQE